MRTARLWAAATLFFGGVAALGIFAVFLEAAGRGWWLACWFGGVLLAVVCARRWEVERKRRLTAPHL